MRKRRPNNNGLTSVIRYLYSFPRCLLHLFREIIMAKMTKSAPKKVVKLAAGGAAKARKGFPMTKKTPAKKK